MKTMKWPLAMWLVRHDISEYNILKAQKEADPLYQEFVLEYEKVRLLGRITTTCRHLANQVMEKYALKTSDHDTNLEDPEAKRAQEVGAALCQKHGDNEHPDVIFVSPYKRTKLTLHSLIRRWPSLAKVRVYEDERIREQEHGLASLYNDWRVFQVLHPEQMVLYDLSGSYWYRYPQGENVPDVRERNRSWMSTVVRDFAHRRILVVTHHLNILALRANLERWDAQKFIHIDHHEKPLNCGVTLYQGNPHVGNQGHLELSYYNKKLYTS